MATQPTTTTIQLTPKEVQLKNLLLDVAKYVDSSRGASEEPVVLRWAGGWVRDRLLGIESHDIDTAINVMTGEAFALKICELCETPETIAKHSISQSDIGNLHKIAKNPDKSKHLETTTIKLFGYDVDFVNLRKETYTDDSRNPTMEFGTAEEDALRRDATINALFYNLNTDKVEDFTTGLQDMESKLIRTPMEPLQTFTDDPLRVLRLVRFASRLGFAIDSSVEEVMGDAQVLKALKLKISRERVGVELEKMLKGNDPRKSLEYINDLGLYHTIFTDPTQKDMPSPELIDWHKAYGCLAFLSQNNTPGSIYSTLVRTNEARYYAWVLAAVSPWARFTESEQKSDKKEKAKARLPLPTLAVREGIRAPTKLCDLVTAAYKNREDVMSLKKAVVSKEPYINERDRFGMAIRRWDSRVGHWRLQVMFALVVEAMQRWSLQPLSSASNDEFLGEWQLFLDHLQELDVMEAPSLSKIIDGTQLAKALGLKPGRWMTKALDVCVAWQLRNPDEVDPEGAVREVDKRRKELDLPEK
ncbi:hypothetical protein F5Y18DRAFT_426406 [Xylariaceae sp. FL1019]|nr:hypothetical protein F5Y18DRAFT_426406 [Xylariaceae sp. FL1019]